MNFEEFLSDPISFISELAQNETQEFDLGIRRMIDEYFIANPLEFYRIPVISTLSDFQKTPPGQIVRLRCSIIEGPAREMFPYRFEHNGVFYSCLINQEIPEFVEEINPRMLGDRLCYTAMSVYPTTEWFRQEISLPSRKAPKNSEDLYAPFRIRVKTTYEYSNRSNLEVVDFIGTFVEDEDDCSAFGSFEESLPTFIGLSYKKVDFYVSPNDVDTSSLDMKEMRGATLEFLNAFFEPLQAKLFLVWLISRTTHFVGGAQIGGLNLNFSGAGESEAQIIDGLLSVLSPLYQRIDVNIEDLNKTDMKPSIKEFEDQHSPLFCSSGTRYLIDETKMDVGELNQTGLNNLDLIKFTAYMNQIKINIYGADYTFNIINSVLSVSGTKSLFSNDISVPIGSLSSPELPEEGVMKMIRYYIDHQQNTNFDVAKTDEEFLNQRLVKYQQEHRSTTQEGLQILFLFMITISKSLGEETITPEACDEAEELYTAINTN